MDKNALIVLTTDIQAQMALVNEISGLVEERARGLSPDDPVRLESVAYQIHNRPLAKVINGVRKVG